MRYKELQVQSAFSSIASHGISLSLRFVYTPPLAPLPFFLTCTSALVETCQIILHQVETFTTVHRLCKRPYISLSSESQPKNVLSNGGEKTLSASLLSFVPAPNRSLQRCTLPHFIPPFHWK